MLGDDVTQEIAPGDPKGAFFWVYPDVEVPEVGEGLLQVEDETAALSGHHDDAIDVDLHVASDLPLKVGLYTPLVGGPAVFSSNDMFT
jgi:hypothetical protein